MVAIGETEQGVVDLEDLENKLRVSCHVNLVGGSSLGRETLYVCIAVQWRQLLGNRRI